MTFLKISPLALAVGSILVSQVTLANQNTTADEQYKTASGLPTIVVNANKIPSSNTVIQADQINKFGSTDMASLVKYQPLVAVPNTVAGTGEIWSGSGATGYNIRGMDGNRVGLDVDGVDLPMATSQLDSRAQIDNNAYGVGRDYIDPEIFSSVNIQSGSVDAHSEGLAGRVSFVTKSPSQYLTNGKKFAGSYKAGYFSANDTISHAATLAAGNEKFKGLVVYSQRDGKETQANTKVALNPADWQTRAILARLEYTPNAQHQLSFVFDRYNKESETTFDMNSIYAGSSNYRNGAVQRNEVERTRYSFEHLYAPEQAKLFDHLDTHLFYQTSKNALNTVAHRSDRPQIRYIDTALNTYTYGAKFKLAKQLGRHHLNFALQADRTQESRPWGDRHYGARTGLLRGTTTNNRMPEMETDKIAFSVIDNIQASNRWVITPQLRAVYQVAKPTDLSDYLTLASTNNVMDLMAKKTKDHYIAPGIAVSYDVNDDVLVYAKYNRNTRLPTSSERTGAYQSTVFISYAVMGNPELKAETADAFELGLKGQVYDGIDLKFSTFYNKYQNYIDYYYNDNPPAELANIYSYVVEAKNLHDVDIWGGEISADVDLGKFISNSDGFGVHLAYGKTNYKARDNSGNKINIGSIQPAKGVFGFYYNSPNDKYGFGLNSTWVASKQAANSSASATRYRVPSYNVQDFYAYWNINSHIKFNVNLNNIFDKRYWDYATVIGLENTGSAANTLKWERATMPERNYSAGLEIKF
ncbi:MAG: TonB-dependent receptor [Acinetobacter sp.]|nr:TonB-dependent receptor [Acinetobacter sp.]